MSPEELSRLLQYPDPWLKHGLLCGELLATQGPAVLREYGSTFPTGGTEHWRYSAFNYWLSRELDEKQLEHLLEAAIADPDPPMVGNVLQAIAQHRHCTQEMLEAAKECATSSRYYYVGASALERLFQSRGRGSEDAP